MLCDFWRTVPPVSVQLKRIALFLGLPEPKTVQTSALKTNSADALQQAQAAGIPVFEGRPDDPMLDLLDL